MMHPVQLYIVYMGTVMGPAKNNGTFGKTMHTGTMYRGLTIVQDRFKWYDFVNTAP
jgi:hypothetical protein